MKYWNYISCNYSDYKCLVDFDDFKYVVQFSILNSFFHIYVTSVLLWYSRYLQKVIDINSINFSHVFYLWQKHKHNRYIRRLAICLRLWATNFFISLYYILGKKFQQKPHLQLHILICIDRIWSTMSQSVILILLH